MDPHAAAVVRPARDFAGAVARAAEHLARGGVVVAATETFYGLLARADDGAAVARVLACKGRPEGKPLPLVVAGAAACARVCAVSAPMAAMMAQFWPGPLTLVLPALGPLAPACCQQGPDGAELAVRASSSPFVAALARAAGAPLTATSANASGAPPARTLTEVRLVTEAGCLAVDDGAAPGGLASTIVRAGARGLEVLRAGAVDPARVRAAWAAATPALPAATR